ncbi:MULTISPECIES: hypothetical protein [Lentzea]|jgi:hypothetical protein|uniref:Uncharacterized protein n=4 Tax=Lentzea TaxID=165301 RepID=A0A1W2EPP9_9PSEU|nr:MULTISPECIES: hypothetical protein [Lentzea]MCX2953047.1 hypothetical protein [Lentzea sp. NEAU-D7]MDX8047834.1 hypothetical protein [Lentzea sp. BCCO 10_0798]SDM42690.1 hypothetical protein SAMN04488074_12176 [Lentzea albidocapillata subsp. violacea]SMD11512.1 hypothetical protein SAMN05660733_04273 [Lentzea albidocapillata]GGN23065.1 hypothetical protein GCM10011609_75590 [Lentzea pudingi]
MLAIIAAVSFGLALILDLAKAALGEVITVNTLVVLGLLLLALHLAGVGTGTRSFGWRRARR